MTSSVRQSIKLSKFCSPNFQKRASVYRDTFIRTLYRASTSVLRCSRGVDASACASSHRPFSGRAAFTTSRESAKSLPEDLDPYHYTSGRWLRRDALEQEMRYIHFDFNALQKKVLALCPGAKYMASCEKKEGGFNRVFVFYTDNNERIVARLPFALAGPSRLTTNSEVATIEYSFPFPRYWTGAIGSEYIIMEHAPGVFLQDKWPHMDVSDQTKCIKSIFDKLKEVNDLAFTVYGSLYFAGTAYLPPSQRSSDPQFCIGPHCGTRYWNCNAGQPRFYHDAAPNQGPWQDFSAYYNGLIDAGSARIPPPETATTRPRWQGSVEVHKQLLTYGRAVLKDLAKSSSIQDINSPMMVHPDLHKRNIFVSEEDPTVVSAIIDWQSTSIDPAFWYANTTPNFAEPIPDLSYKDGWEPKSEACAKLWDIAFQMFARKLSIARKMDEAYYRPFRYCHRTWEDSAASFREELLQTARLWTELGLTVPCPFPMPGSDELALHKKDYRKFEAAHELRESMAKLLNAATDGWAPSYDWGKLQAAHRELYGNLLQTVHDTEDFDEDDPLQSEDDLRELWPFDLQTDHIPQKLDGESVVPYDRHTEETPARR